MKIIDILNKKADGTLEDGFKFCYEDKIYTYNKKENTIINNNTNKRIGHTYVLEGCLNDEVLLFKQETKEDRKEIEEFTSTIESYHSKETICQYCNAQTAKINELVRACNNLLKEREEKQNGR